MLCGLLWKTFQNFQYPKSVFFEIPDQILKCLITVAITVTVSVSEIAENVTGTETAAEEERETGAAEGVTGKNIFLKIASHTPSMFYKGHLYNGQTIRCSL